MSINYEAVRDLDTEGAIARRHGLNFCPMMPTMGRRGRRRAGVDRRQAVIAHRAVGSAAANFLKGRLGRPVAAGVGWGRTREQEALHLSGMQNPQAPFVSLIGFLTRNSAPTRSRVLSMPKPSTFI